PSFKKRGQESEDASSSVKKKRSLEGDREEPSFKKRGQESEDASSSVKKKRSLEGDREEPSFKRVGQKDLKRQKVEELKTKLQEAENLLQEVKPEEEELLFNSVDEVLTTSIPLDILRL
ncbi:MAG: hypothetical protein JSS09_02630, partial [Verrucomicrobia bacterium]|nr:hypothetical protein [Verrucomicrobiota bacterium]